MGQLTCSRALAECLGLQPGFAPSSVFLLRPTREAASITLVTHVGLRGEILAPGFRLAHLCWCGHLGNEPIGGRCLSHHKNNFQRETFYCPYVILLSFVIYLSIGNLKSHTCDAYLKSDPFLA